MLGCGIELPELPDGSPNPTSQEDFPESPSPTEDGDVTGTGSEPTGGDASNKEPSGDETEAPTPEQPQAYFELEEGAELCASHRSSLRNFKDGFSNKGRVRFNGGRFPTERVTISGTLIYNDLEQEFVSEEFAINTRDVGTKNAAAWGFKVPVTGVGMDEALQLRVHLTGEREGAMDTFELGSFENLNTAQEMKEFIVRSANRDKLDIFAGGVGQSYGACKMPERKPEIFAFTFENGDYVEFATKTRDFWIFDPSQRGLTVRATGSIDGHAFDVVDKEYDLLYATREAALVRRAPSLAVRFPEHDGLCGIGFKTDFTDDDDPPYTAHLLDCDLEVIEERVPSKFVIPDGFEIEL